MCEVLHSLASLIMFVVWCPEYSKDTSLARLPYLVSNAVPVSLSLDERWEQLVGQLVPAWLMALGPLNLVVGTVFDNNADSFPDNFLDFRSVSDHVIVTTSNSGTPYKINH